MNTIDQRQRDILRLLWREGRLSRWELHERTGVNPNAIGVDVGELLKKGVVRECQSEPLGPGRPRVPVEIDPVQRHVVGLAINPGRVEIARLNLRGNLVGKIERRNVKDAARIVSAAVDLLEAMQSQQTLAIGLSVTGFVDPVGRNILTSSSTAGQRNTTSLQPIYDAAKSRPIILENNMHALAARWLLTHQAELDEDVLLVRAIDGELGAALLVEGRPNRGCVIGASELGHMRFFVDTAKCYCGHVGCLERICSSDFLKRNGGNGASLVESASQYGDAAKLPALEQLLDYLSMGLANAVNFVRPSRLILVSDYLSPPLFFDALRVSVRSRLLRELAKCVRIDPWDQPGDQSPENAGWLALAQLYREGWLRTTN